MNMLEIIKREVEQWGITDNDKLRQDINTLVSYYNKYNDKKIKVTLNSMTAEKNKRYIVKEI